MTGGRMRRTLWLMLPLLLLVFAACSGSGNGSKNTQQGPADGQATFVPTAASYTPIPGSTALATPYPVPSGTPPMGAINPCVALSNGPQPPNATLPPATPIPPFNPGPQPQRQAVDFSKLQLASSTIPSGYTALNDGKVDATNLAQVAAYPQYAFAGLQTIGFLGARARSWTGPPANGRFPLLALDYFAFANDAGASQFLHDPVHPANQCIKQELGSAIGQETRHDSFQYSGPLQTGNQGLFEGHDVLWRCGRVLLAVQQVGAPGQFSPASADAIARKVQADFVKTQPCS
jgi:hypothetical protein